MESISGIVVRALEDMVGTNDPDFIFSKWKAISALFPYAIRSAQDEHHKMADAISRVAMASNSGRFMWHRIGRYITTLFEKPMPAYLNPAIALASPQVPWNGSLHNENTVTR